MIDVDQVEAKEIARVGSLRLKETERPGDRNRGESHERAVILVQLATDDPSGMRFAVIVKHPEWAHHPDGPIAKSRQAAEVERFPDEKSARDRFAAFVFALGGALPEGFAPAGLAASSPAPAPLDVAALASMLEKADPLTKRRIVEALTKS